MKTLIWFLSVSLLALFYLGCTDEDSSPTEAETLYNLEIAGLPDAPRGPEGVTREAALQVFVTDDAGRPAPDVEVALIVTPSGSVTPAVATTDAAGLIDATLSFSFPEGSANLRLFAIAGAGAASR